MTVLSAVLATALDAVVVMNADGMVTDWNGAAEATFGWSRAEAVGRPMADLIIPPALREAHWHGLSTYLDTGVARILGRRIEVAALHRDGTEFPVELAITPTEVNGQLQFLGYLRDISERQKRDQQQRLLLDELNHRVKNTLATVQSLAAQTARSSTTVEAFDRSFSARLLALARAHDVLTSEMWQGAELVELIRWTVAPYDPDQLRVAVAGPPVRLSPNAAITVNLALHELATNAAKYGGLSQESGRVDVRWSVSEAGLDFEWRESGLTALERPTRQGFGTRLLKAAARELGAEVWPAYGPQGLGYRWLVPLSDKISADPRSPPAAPAIPAG